MSLEYPQVPTKSKFYYIPDYASEYFKTSSETQSDLKGYNKIYKSLIFISVIRKIYIIEDKTKAIQKSTLSVLLFTTPVNSGSSFYVIVVETIFMPEIMNTNNVDIIIL